MEGEVEGPCGVEDDGGGEEELVEDEEACGGGVELLEAFGAPERS